MRKMPSEEGEKVQSEFDGWLPVIEFSIMTTRRLTPICWLKKKSCRGLLSIVKPSLVFLLHFSASMKDFKGYNIGTVANS